MKFSVDRLDRFVSKHSAFAISQVRLLIAQKRIVLDGSPAVSAQQKVTKFTHVMLDGVCLQELTPVYIMLNKPRGVVSATKDARHTTVIDLLEHRQKDELHIAGRLDFNTTGLLLLSNDGSWSRRLSLPETKLIKTYKVTLSKPETLKRSIYSGVSSGSVFRVRGYYHVTSSPRDPLRAHGVAVNC